MAVKTISVSELKCACLDVKWRNEWLKGNKPSTDCTKGGGPFPVKGTAFHKIVADFVDCLIEAKNKKATVELNDGNRLWGEMYERFAVKILNEILGEGQVESAYHLSQCLMSFCDHLVDLRNRTEGFKSWQDVFLAKEAYVKDVHFPFGANSIFVSGKIDAVRTHPQNQLEIVDYKLSRGDNMKHDMLQIAVYARLLTMTNPAIKFHGTIEYYLPKLDKVSFNADELDSIFTEIVAPVLCELASETIDLSDDIKRFYEQFKLSVEVIGKVEAPQLVRYKLIPASGLKIAKLAGLAKDLKVRLALSHAPLISESGGFVTIDIPKERPDTVPWRDIVNTPEYLVDKSPVSFPVGIGIDNKVIIADFADPNMCHAIVAGTSGSGKSEFLKSMVASLIAKNKPHSLKLMIIDPKKVTFAAKEFEAAKCQYQAENEDDYGSSTIVCLEKTVEDMESRFKQFALEGLDCLSARFKAGKEDIPFHIIIIDEFGDIILTLTKDKKKLFENLIIKLAQKGRAAGIHLVLTTQHPVKEIVTGLIRANLPLKICLRVTKPLYSQIIINEGGAEALLGKGDLLCIRGKGIERGQSPFITSKELSQLFAKRL
ncbi:MAG: PD-(D/E)XK nuclease family protein [Nitrospirae bacterium]|nr:PD-(D/E)XK nuclease family protein [Nitrospirota bacterium]